MLNPQFLGPLTWAFVIIVCGIIITPGGINPIVTNSAVRIAIGVTGLILGVLGAISSQQALLG
jgi:hypothetical protein